jgi:hypothetical protein
MEGLIGGGREAALEDVHTAFAAQGVSGGDSRRGRR